MGEFPAAATRQVVFGAACWALSIAFLAVQAVAQAASARPYSLATNLISDLGITACGVSVHDVAVCSPLHGLVNGTFLVVGLLHAVGALTTWGAWPRGRLTASGLILLTLAGACLAVTGLAPENVGPGTHTLAALVGIVSLNGAMILLGLGIGRAAGALGTLALVAGIVGLAGTVVFFAPSTGVPPGVAERVADWPAAAMVVVLGAYLLASAAGPAGARAPATTDPTAGR